MSLGKEITLAQIRSDYDAVFLGVGAGLPTFLKVPGENLIGIMSANEYLTRSNLMKAYLYPKYDTPVIVGKNVITLGAGNVAMDSARTALSAWREKITYCIPPLTAGSSSKGGRGSSRRRRGG